MMQCILIIRPFEIKPVLMEESSDTTSPLEILNHKKHEKTPSNEIVTYEYVN